MKSIHGKIDDTQWPKCEYKTSQKIHLNNHVKFIQKTIKGKQRTKCKYKTNYKGRLGYHMKSIH